MSVNITVKQTNPIITNILKWKSVNSNDFVILEGSEKHPIPYGLYRIFIISDQELPPVKDIMAIPMFAGPFEENLFPYAIPLHPPEELPTIKQTINNITIEVNVD